MEIRDLQLICHDLPGTTQDIKWEDHLCFCVGKKIYLITSPDQVPHRASFRVSENDFEQILGMSGVVPAPYLARYHWVQVDDINRLSRPQWEKYIYNSYDLVYRKLPAKMQQEIGFMRKTHI